VGAVAGALSVIAASFAAVGVAGTLGFLNAPSLSTSATPIQMTLGFTGLFAPYADGRALWLLSLLAAVPAAAVAGWLGVVARRCPAHLEPALAGAVALSLLAAPHLLVHDLVLLAPVAVWMTAWVLAREPSHVGASAVSSAARGLVVVAGLWVMLNEAGFADNGNRSTSAPGRLVPWVLLLISAVAVWTGRRASGPVMAAPSGQSAHPNPVRYSTAR
jgi:hypothetical protein